VTKGLTAHDLLFTTFLIKRATRFSCMPQPAASASFCVSGRSISAPRSTIIGAVGSKEKAALARRHGCDHAIVYTREDFAAAVKQPTDGRGVPVVLRSPQSIGTKPSIPTASETRSKAAFSSLRAGPLSCGAR
jgi:NADPH2:quinone reductase